MACRIQSIKPPCAYNIEGIERILLLDFEDFQGFKFEGDDLYANCRVIGVQRKGSFVELDTPASAKYNSTEAAGKYTHTIETFIPGLTASNIVNLHLSTKRRYLAFFLTKMGRYFVFGYEAGTGVTYANQTAEATGSLVTITCESIYPLFEVSAAAVTGEMYGIEFLPDFTYAYCLPDKPGIRQASIAYKVSRPGGVPLDEDDNPVSASGKKQMISLLIGYINPDAALYQIAYYFGKGEAVTGNATQMYDTDACPVGAIWFIPDSIVLTPMDNVQTFELKSLNPWSRISGATIADTTPNTGGSGAYTIVVTRTNILGQSSYVYRDEVTLKTYSVYVINTDNPDLWVLEGGTWHNLGFWSNGGIWNF